jgi:hypothetical protein
VKLSERAVPLNRDITGDLRSLSKKPRSYDTSVKYRPSENQDLQSNAQGLVSEITFYSSNMGMFTHIAPDRIEGYPFRWSLRANGTSVATTTRLGKCNAVWRLNTAQQLSFESGDKKTQCKWLTKGFGGSGNWTVHEVSSSAPALQRN